MGLVAHGLGESDFATKIHKIKHEYFGDCKSLEG